MAERSFMDRPRTVLRTMVRTAEALRHHKLGMFIPVFLVLLVGAGVLWMVNTIAPLAPFVYSLF